MSPAVLTETVWALAFPADQATTPTIPDRVIALTTTVGRDEIRKQLFGGDAVWESLRRAVLGPKFAADPRLCFGLDGECVKVFTRNVGGKLIPLKEVSTEDDNTTVADCITDVLWGHVAKPGTRLIASISGGFKTMSALLFAGMSLLGRKGDLITHVLVNSPFDTVLTPRFFFPKQPQQELKDRDGAFHHAKDAQLRLGYVPFVPLHDLLENYQKPRSYSDLVAAARGHLGRRLRQPVRLRLRLSRRQVGINDTVQFTLGAQPFLFLLFLAEQARAGQPAFVKYVEAMSPFQQFVQKLPATPRGRAIPWMNGHPRLLPAGFAEALRERSDQPVRTKLLFPLTQKLAAIPGAGVLASWLPEPGRCSLDLPPGDIEILD